jgi:hypothetical protein
LVWRLAGSVLGSRNGRNGGALQSNYGGHLNGRFPSSAVQKRSGWNPTRCSYLDSANSRCQIAIKVTEPALEAFRNGTVCRIASSSYGLSTRNESVSSQEKVSRIVKCARTVERTRYCAFLACHERRFEPAA